MKLLMNRFLAFSLSVLLSLVTVPITLADDPQITDTAITDNVEDELLFDHGVASHKIDINTIDGIVKLTGSVDNILAKERAARIAETVKGVRAVVNNISVVPSVTRSDEDVETDVEIALGTDPATDSWEISASVEDGAATLTGTVESWQERELSATVAKGVAGVTELKNEIEVSYDTERPDSEIQAEIEQALRWSVLVDDGLIDVEVNDGQVALTGTAGSAAEKRIARTKAWVAGVDGVDDSGLNVERWARDEDLRADKYVVKADEDIREAINDALLYDPRVSSFEIDVDVDAGDATLRGTVNNLMAKRAAADTARNTVGVRWVTNRVKVRSENERADSHIKTSIENAIENDAYLEDQEVTATVSNGIVRLYGDVDSYFEKTRAENLVERVYGADLVYNYLDVVYDSTYTYDPYVDYNYIDDYDWYSPDRVYTVKRDAGIEEDVEDQLVWSPYVDADDVTVFVDDGVATLTGTVDTWLERDKAEENAWEGGAGWVDNDLIVE